jgi:NAD(P)-dependent dehydrogenase (short-subunit alcohol dehydrogenase family)
VIAIFGGGEIAAFGIAPALADSDVRLINQPLVDVTDERQVELALALGNPSVVVFTAGVSRPMALWRTDSEWREEIYVNLIGAFTVAAAASRTASVKTMVFISSLAGLYGKPNHAGYSASKAGVISLVQSLALEGQNAYCISPGRVNTTMRERDYPGEDPRTRLDPLLIGEIVRDILDGKYTPGDNIVIRMRGHEVLPLEIHRGDGWRERLKVGEPVTC